MNAASLLEAVRACAAGVDGTVAVSVRDLERGRQVDLHPEERFPSASIIKVPILVELFAQAEAGQLQLDETIPLRDADRVEGSGVLSMLHLGVELSLRDLAHLMIVISDNTASNMLIERVTCDAVNRRLASLGCKVTRLGRKFYDFAARDRGLDNWAAAGEFAALLAGIEQRKVVSAAACEAMLGILKKQQFSGRIPALLPPDTVVAHKTGSITNVSHDVGVIYAPAGPLVLAVLTQGVAPAWKAEKVIREIALTVYDHWGEERNV